MATATDPIDIGCYVKSIRGRWVAFFYEGHTERDNLIKTLLLPVGLTETQAYQMAEDDYNRYIAPRYGQQRLF